MNTLNAPQKSMLMIILIVIAFVSFATMACDDGGANCTGQNAEMCNPAAPLLAPAGEVQTTVTDFLKSTCDKDAAGNCKTMGQP